MSGAGRESPRWPCTRPWPAGRRTSTRSTSASGCSCGRGNDASRCRASISSGETRKISRRISTNRSTRSSTRPRSSSFRGSPNRFGRRANSFSREGVLVDQLLRRPVRQERETMRSGRRSRTRNTCTGPSRSGNSFRASNRCPATRTTRVDFRFEVKPGFPVRLPVDPRAIRRAVSEDPVPGADPESPRFLRSPGEEGGPDFHGVGVPDRQEAMIFPVLT